MQADLLKSNVLRAAVIATMMIDVKSKTQPKEEALYAIHVARQALEQYRGGDGYLTEVQAKTMHPYNTIRNIHPNEQFTVNALIATEAQTGTVPHSLFDTTPHGELLQLSLADDLLVFMARNVRNAVLPAETHLNETLEDNGSEVDASESVEHLNELIDSAVGTARTVITFEHYIRFTILRLLEDLKSRKSPKYSDVNGAIKHYNRFQ